LVPGDAGALDNSCLPSTPPQLSSVTLLAAVELLAQNADVELLAP